MSVFTLSSPEVLEGGGTQMTEFVDSAQDGEKLDIMNMSKKYVRIPQFHDENEQHFGGDS